MKSSSRLVQSVVWPVLFNIFINDLDEGTESMVSGFADDVKLRGVFDTLQFKGTSTGCRNEPTVISSSSTEKCKILYLGRNNPLHQHRPGIN